MQTFVKTCIHPVSVLVLVSITTVALVLFNSDIRNANMMMGSDINQVQSEQLEIKGIGVLGDSMSDEYRADDARETSNSFPAYNWVELLVSERDLNFGEWGTYAEPRRSGYAYNWARSSATAQSMIDAGQHTGLANQIRNKEVNTVFIFIGANDFAPYTGDGYPAIYNESLSDTQLQEKVDGIIRNIETAVDTIQQAGEVYIILVKIPDWGNHMSVQESFPDPDRRTRVSNAIFSTNDLIEELANRSNIRTVDPNMLYEDLFSGAETVTRINGIEFDRNSVNSTPTNVFLADDVHLGTVFNGLLANYFIETINSEYGLDISPLTHDEIFRAAGIQ